MRTIINMVQLTRLDCAVASAGLMRMGLALRRHHARHRSAFEKKLVDQPADARGAGRHGARSRGHDGAVACGSRELRPRARRIQTRRPLRGS